MAIWCHSRITKQSSGVSGNCGTTTAFEPLHRGAFDETIGEIACESGGDEGDDEGEWKNEWTAASVASKRNADKRENEGVDKVNGVGGVADFE
jgi:hypothetical protein